MTQCPYPQTITEDNIEMSNEKYLIWHEGYEAHKFELANRTIRVALLAQGLEDEIKQYKLLKSRIADKEIMEKPTG